MATKLFYIQGLVMWSVSWLWWYEAVHPLYVWVSEKTKGSQTGSGFKAPLASKERSGVVWEGLCLCRYLCRLEVDHSILVIRGQGAAWEKPRNPETYCCPCHTQVSSSSLFVFSPVTPSFTPETFSTLGSARSLSKNNLAVLKVKTTNCCPCWRRFMIH